MRGENCLWIPCGSLLTVPVLALSLSPWEVTLEKATGEEEKRNFSNLAQEVWNLLLMLTSRAQELGSSLYHHTEKDHGVGMRNVLHPFYLFIQIRARSQFFLTRHCPRHHLRRAPAADRSLSAQEGFLQVTRTARPCAFLLHFKKTWHLFPFGKAITQTDRIFPMKDICTAPYILAQFGLH